MEKIKKIFAKYWIYILLFCIVAILLMLVFLLRGRDSDDLSNIVFEEEAFLEINQPLGYYKNYNLSFENNVLQEIDSFTQEHSAFQIIDINRLNIVEYFVGKIGRNLEYTQISPTTLSEDDVDFTIHYWQDLNDTVSYNMNTQMMYAKFKQPIEIFEINFNPVERNSVSEVVGQVLSNYFNVNYEYEIHSVVSEGSYYRIEYSRTLNNIPLYREIGSDYIILTQEGALREISFLIAEFVEYPDLKYEILSASQLTDQVSQASFPKNISYEILDEEVNERYQPYGYHLVADSVEQKGNIYVKSAKLVYLYFNEVHPILVPTFLLQGEGTLDIDREAVESRFSVLANAINLNYIYTPSQTDLDIFVGN